MSVLVAACPLAFADRAGWYIGAGVSVAEFQLAHQDLRSSFRGTRTNGWRVEGGYLWDPGRAGGFHLGVQATFDDWAAVEKSGEYVEGSHWDDRVKIHAATVQVMLEQELVSWLDFVFRAGPSYALVDVSVSRTPAGGLQGYSDEADIGSLGARLSIGLLFFPLQRLSIELAAEGSGYLVSGGFFNTLSLGALSTSLQYRF